VKLEIELSSPAGAFNKLCVCVNGEAFVASFPGTRFSIDATPWLRFGNENKIQIFGRSAVESGKPGTLSLASCSLLSVEDDARKAK
jgi:hypothetical protein